jgi:putative SOS response-associated peptidase YedK
MYLPGRIRFLRFGTPPGRLVAASANVAPRGRPTNASPLVRLGPPERDDCFSRAIVGERALIFATEFFENEHAV